jgi:hypothetical protein
MEKKVSHSNVWFACLPSAAGFHLDGPAMIAMIQKVQPVTFVCWFPPGSEEHDEFKITFLLLHSHCCLHWILPCILIDVPFQLRTTVLAGMQVSHAHEAPPVRCCLFSGCWEENLATVEVIVNQTVTDV